MIEISPQATWTQIGVLFDQLASLSASERSLRLEGLRAENPKLATELESLLRAHDAAEGFLEDFVADRVPELFAPAIPDFAKGERILQFEIIEKLGEGSQAKVYLVRDVDLGRNVALKISVNQSQEAQTLAHFSLDGIVQIYSEHLYQHENLTLRLICLQYVAGPTLGELGESLPGARNLVELIQRRAKRGAAFEPTALKWRELLLTLTIPEALVQLGIRLAEILDHAHSKGVLHLDIKPANILIDPYGRPFLSDFNVSTYTKRINSGDLQGLGGTPRYMAPEQAQAFEADDAAQFLHPQCDVFALGKVLHELLEKTGTVAPHLDEILRQATAETPEARTPSARALAQDLTTWLRKSRAEEAMPRLGTGLGWIRQSPILAVVLLTVASQGVASFINITYNHAQIVSALSIYQRDVFFKTVALYNLLTYPLTLLYAAYSFRVFFRSNPNVKQAREAVLNIPFVVFATISFGWLPGAWIFPRVIDSMAGPVDISIYWHFAGSFFLAWLVSLTTSLTVTIYVMARILYPRFWSLNGQQVTRDLSTVIHLSRWLPFASALIPMSGILMGALTTASAANNEAFRCFLLVTLSFGLLNLFFVHRVTQWTETTLRILRDPGQL